MKNISFQAHLVVNENLYNNMPKDTPPDYTDKLVSGLQKFLDDPVIQKVTEGDTVELKRHNGHYAFGIDMNVTNGKTKETMNIEFRQSKNPPSMGAGSFIMQFFNYLAQKFDIMPGLFESRKHFNTRLLIGALEQVSASDKEDIT